MSAKKIKVSQLPRILSGSLDGQDILHVLSKGDDTFYKGSTLYLNDFVGWLETSQTTASFAETASFLSGQGQDIVLGNTIISGSVDISGSLFINGQDLYASSQSISTRLTTQEDFSSSLNAMFATDAELTSLSSSIVSTITTDSSSFETRITTQENFSSSLDATFATDAELESVSSSFETRISDLNSFSSSLENVYFSSSGQNVTFGIVTASNANVSGDLIVGGTIQAEQFITEFVSSSILYESGSTKFGDSLDDTHEFTGSVDITGSLFINGQDLYAFSQSITTDSSSFETRVSTLENRPITQVINDIDDRVLSLSDVGGYVRLTSTSSASVTIPENASVNWAAEEIPPTIYFRLVNDPVLIITTGSNAVTLNNPQNFETSTTSGSVFALQWVSTDEWDLI